MSLLSDSTAAAMDRRGAPDAVAVRLRSTRNVLWILLVIGILRAATALIRQTSDPNCCMSGDSPSYENPARALLHTGRFSQSPETPDRPETIRTPGYPLFLTSVYSVFGERRLPAILIQILLSLGTLYATWRIALRIFGEIPALWAVFLFALDPISFYLSQMILSDSLYVLFLMLAAWVGVDLFLCPDRRPLCAFLLGLALTAATFVRPIGYYLIFPTIIGVVAWSRFVGLPRRTTLLLLLLLLFSGYIPQKLWEYRNDRLTGSLEFSQIKNVNLLLYRGAGIVALRDRITLDEAQRRLIAEIPGGASGGPNFLDPQTARWCSERGKRLIRDHPRLFLKTEINGLMKMILVPGEADLGVYLGASMDSGGPAGDLRRLSFSEYIRKWLGKHPVWLLAFTSSALYLLVLYSGAAAGLMRLRRRRSDATGNLWAAHLFLIGIVAYLIALSVGPEAYARFRAPVAPILSIYAGMGLAILTDRLRSRS